jgi:hypothetical protein
MSFFCECENEFECMCFDPDHFLLIDGHPMPPIQALPTTLVDDQGNEFQVVVLSDGREKARDQQRLVGTVFYQDGVDQLEVRWAEIGLDKNWAQDWSRNDGMPALRVQVNTGTKRADILRLLTKVIDTFPAMEVAAEDAYALYVAKWEAIHALEGPFLDRDRRLKEVKDALRGLSLFEVRMVLDWLHQVYPKWLQWDFEE